MLGQARTHCLLHPRWARGSNHDGCVDVQVSHPARQPAWQSGNETWEARHPQSRQATRVLTEVPMAEAPLPQGAPSSQVGALAGV